MMLDNLTRNSLSTSFTINVFFVFAIFNVENAELFMYEVTNGSKICNPFLLTLECLLTMKSKMYRK